MAEQNTQEQPKRMYKYKDTDMNLDSVYTNVMHNAQKYADYNNFSDNQRAEFSSALNNYMVALKEGRLSSDAMGNIVDTGGMLDNGAADWRDKKGDVLSEEQYNSLKKRDKKKATRDFYANREVATLMDTVLRKMYDEKQNTSNSDAATDDAPVFDINNGVWQGFRRYAMPNDNSDLMSFVDMDVYDKKTKKRGTANRAAYFRKYIDRYIAKLPQNMSFKDSEFTDRNDYINTLNELKQALSDGTVDASDFRILSRLGGDPAGYRQFFTTAEKPETEQASDTASSGTTSGSSQSDTTETSQSGDTKSSTEGGTEKAATPVETVAQVLDRKLKAAYLASYNKYPDTYKYYKYNRAPGVTYEVGQTPNETINNYYAALGQHNITDTKPFNQWGLGGRHNNTRLLNQFVSFYANNPDVVQRVTDGKFQGSIVLPGSLNKADGSVVLRNQKQQFIRAYIGDLGTVGAEIYNRNYRQQSKKIGGKFAGGGGMDAIDAQMKRVQAQRRADNSNHALFSTKDANAVNAGMTASDWTRVASVVPTIASMLDQEPLSAAGLGAIGTTMNLGADIAEGKGFLDIAKNAAVGYGLDLLGAIPVFGKSAAAGKLTKIFGSLVPKLISWAALAYTANTAPEAIKNGVASLQKWNKPGPENQMTMKDWNNILQMLYVGMAAKGAVKGIAARAKAAGARTGKYADVLVRTNEGKKLVLRFQGSEAEQIRNAKTTEDVKNVLKKHPSYADYEPITKTRRGANPNLRQTWINSKGPTKYFWTHEGPVVDKNPLDYGLMRDQYRSGRWGFFSGAKWPLARLEKRTTLVESQNVKPQTAKPQAANEQPAPTQPEPVQPSQPAPAAPPVKPAAPEPPKPEPTKPKAPEPEPESTPTPEPEPPKPDTSEPAGTPETPTNESPTTAAGLIERVRNKYRTGVGYLKGKAQSLYGRIMGETQKPTESNPESVSEPAKPSSGGIQAKKLVSSQVRDDELKTAIEWLREKNSAIKNNIRITELKQTIKNARAETNNLLKNKDLDSFHFTKHTKPGEILANKGMMESEFYALGIWKNGGSISRARKICKAQQGTAVGNANPLKKTSDRNYGTGYETDLNYDNGEYGTTNKVNIQDIYKGNPNLRASTLNTPHAAEGYDYNDAQANTTRMRQLWQSKNLRNQDFYNWAQNWYARNPGKTQSDMLRDYNNAIDSMYRFKHEMGNEGIRGHQYRADEGVGRFNDTNKAIYGSANNPANKDLIGFDEKSKNINGTATAERFIDITDNDVNMDFSNVDNIDPNMDPLLKGIVKDKTGRMYVSNGPKNPGDGNKLTNPKAPKQEGKNVDLTGIFAKLKDMNLYPIAKWALARNANKALEMQLPVMLKDPLEQQRWVYGDLAAMQLGNKQGAQAMHLASQPLTSDGSLAAARQLEAMKTKNDSEWQGFLKNDDTMTKSSEAAWQVSAENKKNRHDTAMENRASIFSNQVQNIAQRQARIKADYQSDDNLLSYYQQKYELNQAENKAMKQNLEMQAIKNQVYNNPDNYGVVMSSSDKALWNGIRNNTIKYTDIEKDPQKVAAFNRIKQEVSDALVRQMAIRYGVDPSLFPIGTNKSKNKEFDPETVSKDGVPKNGDGAKIEIQKLKNRVKAMELYQKNLNSKMKNYQKDLDRAQRSASQYIKGQVGNKK